jgi:hypothetical protein
MHQIRKYFLAQCSSCYIVKMRGVFLAPSKIEPVNNFIQFLDNKITTEERTM